MLRGAAVTLTDLPGVVDALTEKNANTVFSQVALTSSASDEPALTSFKRPLVFPIDWIDSLQNTEEKGDEKRAEDGKNKDSQSNSQSNIAKQCYDVVLLTDCVFSASLSVALVATILRFCGEKSSVICCHEIRDEQANDAFLKEFSRHFDWKRTPRSRLHPDFNNDQIEIIVGKPLRKRSSHKLQQQCIAECGGGAESIVSEQQPVGKSEKGMGTKKEVTHRKG